ncbi:CatB-related O-acetyltransferase [Macrococcoides goetzii]|nr:CatB-related O-acetyltransferase [Macrococcus goetzii]TDM46084.1 CatB-related O-acetyltransferase [Macrococcus goetzii]
MNIIKETLLKMLSSRYIFSKKININHKSLVSPKVMKNIPKSLNKGISIKDSELFGDIKLHDGVKISKSICSGEIEIGRFVSINGPATRISSKLNGIQIGSYSSIASNVVIQEDFHRMDRITTYFIHQNLFNKTDKNESVSKGKIIIEEDVWIGSNSTILSGVKIGRGSVIGAGSVITKDVPRYSIVVGNPGRVIKKRFNDNVIDKLEKSKWWEKDVEDLKNMEDDFSKNINESTFFENWEREYEL